jgi:hypothetical protein
VRRAIEHRGEAEELAGRRLVDDHVLMVLVDGRDLDRARHHHVAAPAAIADLVDALPRRELLQLNLRGEHGGLFFVEQGEQGNLFQHGGVTGHGSPHG